MFHFQSFFRLCGRGLDSEGVMAHVQVHDSWVGHCYCNCTAFGLSLGVLGHVGIYREHRDTMGLASWGCWSTDCRFWGRIGVYGIWTTMAGREKQCHCEIKPSEQYIRAFHSHSLTIFWNPGTAKHLTPSPPALKFPDGA